MVRLAILIASMLIATPADGGDPVAPGAQPSAERATHRDIRNCLRWVETVHGVELATRYCRCAFEILDREDVEKRTRAMTEEQERAYYAEITSRCKPPEMVLLPDFVADWHAIQTSAFQASIPCRIEAQEQGVQTAAGLVKHVLWVCQARDRIFALSYRRLLQGVRERPYSRRHHEECRGRDACLPGRDDPSGSASPIGPPEVGQGVAGEAHRDHDVLVLGAEHPALPRGQSALSADRTISEG
jgi:hypothetical protein